MPAGPSVRKLVVFVTTALLMGCPTRFDPRAETIRGSSNPQADHDYRQARARLDVGDLPGAADRYKTFLEKYPSDPLVPSAKLGLARALLGLGEHQKAKEIVEPMGGGPVPDAGIPATDPDRAKARYLYGLTLHRAGQYAEARTVLKPFVGQIVAGDDAFELFAVLAEDAAKLGDIDEALADWNQFWPGARPAERVYVRDHVAQLVAKMSAMEALKSWNAVPHDTLAAAYLGRRLAAERRAAGDLSGEKQMLEDSKAARERAGLDDNKSAPSSGPTLRAVGCVLGLSGRGRALGERALRGALLGADLPLGEGDLPAIELRLRDDSGDPTKAANAVDELAAEGVIAVIGPPDKNEAQLAAPRADKLGVPFFGLARDDAKRGDRSFKMVRPRTAVASALVARAVGRGAKTAAIVAPDSAYGRSLAEDIKAAADKVNLRIVLDLRYAESATTFVEPAKKLKSAGVDALFVPAAAAQLQLFAPQLASSGLVKMVNVKPTGKTLTVYATGDGINANFLTSTGKYLQGAILAPTFYADPNDPALAAFIERYKRTYNEEPTSLDALSFDAVRAARQALAASGSVSRADLAAQLARQSDPGLTGPLGFVAGERLGAPPLYIVEGNELRVVK
jgi:ABC-type branched-subunit amino acid transport system substrate-binding protein